MNTTQATADVFWTAFRSLPKREIEAVVERLVRDKEFMEDLIDVVILAQLEKEPSRPLGQYLAAHRKKPR